MLSRACSQIQVMPILRTRPNNTLNILHQVLMLYCQKGVQFWCKHPALFYGITLLLGIAAFMQQFLLILIPVIVLWIPFIFCIYYGCLNVWKPLILSVTLFGVAGAYVHVYYVAPALPPQGIKGTAHISIESMRLQSTFFGKRWIYYCQLKSFFPDSTPDQSIARHIKCTIAFPQAETIRPLAHQDYLLKSRLIQTSQGGYILKTSPLTPWQEVKNSWNLTETRYQWKKKVQQWITAHFSNPLSAHFLGGLATGEFDDQWLRQEFARFGLQHIMAISGFHFAIITAVLSLISQLFLSRKKSAILLLCILSAYAFFLGSNPSILRSWLMCSLVLLGCLLEKSSLALNSLGIALMGVLLFDPYFITSIAFQFSFLTTAAILLVFPIADYYLSLLLLKRGLSQVIEMNSWDQHGYCLLAFFRQALALMIAVNLFALPLTLYYFNQFPWMSLIYNLFFPLLITGSMTLLILGAFTFWIPLVGPLINDLNNSYTNTVLKLTYQLPASLDLYLSISSLSVGLLMVYFSFMIGGIILIREKLLAVEDAQEFAFI